MINKDMEKDPGIELLNRIAEVDPPPFLFTRIEARINAPAHGVVPRRWVFVAGFSLALLLAVNTFAVQRRIHADRSGRDAMTELASGMGLRTSNQLYNE